jgi:hypothetical protein
MRQLCNRVGYRNSLMGAINEHEAMRGHICGRHVNDPVGNLLRITGVIPAMTSVLNIAISGAADKYQRIKTPA